MIVGLRSGRTRWNCPTADVLAPYHVIEQPDWVTALALTHDGNIILIEEYRHGCQQTVVELPSGIHDKPGEPTIEADEARAAGRDGVRQPTNGIRWARSSPARTAA